MTRSEFLQSAIRRLLSDEQPVTLETVKRRIPDAIGADLTDEELGRAYAEVEDSPSHVGAPPVPPATTEAEAEGTVKAAQRRLAECRGVVNQRTQELDRARGALHAATRAYLAGGVPFTELDQARAFQATSQADRAARAARFGTGTSAAAKRYVQKRMQNPTRGGFPQSWVGRTDPRFVPPESK